MQVSQTDTALNLTDNYPPRRQFNPLGAGGWATASFVLTYAISAVLYIPLARLLGPDDFGLYSEATLVYAGLTLVIELGLIRALVRTPGDRDEVAQATFWLALLSGLVGTLLCALVGFPLALIYNNPDLVLLLILLSPGVLAIALGAIPHALLSRELDFRRKLLPEAVSAGVGAVVALVAAFLHAGVYSLIIYTVVRVGLNSVVAWWVVGWKPTRRRPQARLLKQLLGFALPAGLGEIALYARFNIDTALTGLRLGTATLGVYALAWSTSDRPALLLNAFFSNVGYATFARLGAAKAHRESLRRIYLSATRLLAALALPVFGAGVLVRQDLVAVVLGSRWLGVTEPLFGLFILQAFWVIFYPATTLLLALGYSRTYAWVNNASLILTAIVVFIGTFGGVTGVAWAMLVAVGSTSLVWAVLVSRLLHLKLSDWWQVFKLPLLLTVLTLAVIFGIQTLCTVGHLSNVIRLAAAILAGIAALASMVKMWGWAALRQDMAVLRQPLPA